MKSFPAKDTVLLYALAKSSHLIDALGKNSRERNLVTAMMIAQALSPSSKLAAVNYISESTLADELGVGGCDVDDYYSALDWLVKQ